MATTKTKKFKVGIIGGAGYTAGELIRILINHPGVEIGFVHSSSNAGNYLYDVHEGLFGDTDLKFCDSFDLNSVNVLFLCSAHGKSKEFWQQNERPKRLKIIDLAQDFRDESEAYVYGLPEMQKERIAKAGKIANPGCFATAIQLVMPITVPIDSTLASPQIAWMKITSKMAKHKLKRFIFSPISVKINIRVIYPFCLYTLYI